MTYADIDGMIRVSPESVQFPLQVRSVVCTSPEPLWLRNNR